MTARLPGLVQTNQDKMVGLKSFYEPNPPFLMKWCGHPSADAVIQVLMRSSKCFQHVSKMPILT